MEGRPRGLRSSGAFLVLLFILGIWNCAGSSGKDETEDPSKGNSKSETSAEEAPSEGETLYIQHCGSCHQRNGGGVPGMYPPLKGTETVKGDEEKLIRIVLEGMEGSIEVKGQRYDQPMPAQDHLSDEEVAKVLSYVREEFGDGAGEVTAAEVGGLRGEGSD